MVLCRSCNGAPPELPWSAAGAAKVGHRSCKRRQRLLQTSDADVTGGATVLSARAVVRLAGVDVLPASPLELQWSAAGAAKANHRSYKRL